jgi:L,D-transpeptidase YcbB
MPKLEKGLRDPEVANLRNRLSITQGNIGFNIEDKDLFDQSLHDQVVLFQRRNGLVADGVVGRATIEALNIPVEDRIATIKVNLERWRWLSNNLGNKYIMVNIANYELQAIENDKIVFNSEAIVGRPYRRTPVFSSVITYLVFNPYWTVPPTILFNDVIPAVIKNPDYLENKKMKVLRTDGAEIDPASIDWNRAAPGNFPYRIRQEPGPENALGKVKFMFPNQYSVYIHDTPVRNLFLHTDRSFSSGCIRINKPLEFAAYLLKDNPAWTPAQIKNVVDQGRERTVTLSGPVPVHLLYLTAWADDEGVVYFRKDIYDRDQRLMAALIQVPKLATQ